MVKNEILELIKKENIFKIFFSDSLINIKKVNVRKVELKNHMSYQLEYFLDNKAYHENLDKEDLIKSLDEYIFSFKQIQIQSEKKIYTLHMKKDKYKLKEQVNNNIQRVQKHNKEKKYILNEGEDIDFLKELGLMSSDNKVYKKGYNKFRQINKYLEIIENTINKMIEKI